MADNEQFDLIVLGGGPGGYVAAIRAAQLGMQVACVEKESALGGTCLRVGCIPSKALLDSSELYDQIRHNASKHGLDVGDVSVDVGRMLKRKDEVVTQLTKGVEGLFKKNKVTWARGFGRLAGTDRVEVEGSEGKRTLQAKNIILASGSVPVELPFLKFDHERIIDSTGALSIPEVPGHLVVVGGGVIGLELGSVWLRLGDKVIVSIEGQEPLEADYLLVAVGRRAYTEGMGLEEAGVRLERGVIQVDERFHTGVGNVYAIGDAIGGRMLAHKAEEEGVAAVEFAAGKHGHVNYDAVANVVYTWPEIASVGMTEEEAKAAGREYRIGKFPFQANGRARAMGETDGMVKVIADAGTDRLLG